MNNLDEIEITVLKVMHSRNLYGAKHIRLEKVTKSGFPSHLRGQVKDAINSLVKKGFILYAKRSKDAIQLNKDKSQKIQQIISKSLTQNL